jgi:hypothetical protein
LQSVGKTQLRRVRYVSRNAAGALINDGIWVFRASALGTSKSRNEIPVARVLFSSRFLWRFDYLNFTGATSPQKASGASALSKHPPTPPTQRESHHGQTSYRYYRFGHCFFDIRFGVAMPAPAGHIERGLVPRFRDIPNVSRNVEANPQVQSTEQGSQSWDVTG